MLVMSSSVVLAEADDIPPGTPFIGWRNLVTVLNVTADSEDADYPATNLANPLTTNEWRSETTAEQYLTAAVATLDDVDYVGIARHNFGSAGIAVSIGYDDGGWVELVAPQIPADDQPMMFVFTPQSLAAVQVKLAAGSEAPRAAVLYVGKLLVCERGFPVDGKIAVPRFRRKTTVVNGRSESGDYTGRIVTGQWRGFDIAFTHLTPDWYREAFDPFLEAAQDDTPFFYAWASVDYPYEVAYAWLQGEDPEPDTDPVTGRVDVTLSCGGILS